MIRIAIADDHMIIRDGLKTLLDMEDDFEIVAEAETGRQTIEVCKLHRPDVLILDFEMPDMDGLDVLKTLATSGLDMKIVILTMYGTVDYAVRMLKSGASAFIPKIEPTHKMPNIVRQVMKGHTYIPEDLKQAVLDTMMNLGNTKTTDLTDRELQVFAGYARGKDVSEIADMLHISPRTVETHKRNIMRKLGVKNSFQLLKAAIREGIIEKL